MSGLDPLAALAANAALSQSQVQALDLGIAVELLEQQLTVGDLLTATVLPAQGGVDLLSLFGTTVAAQLPTGVNPGQSLLLQVTGFQGNQILVQNLGIVDPENPPSTVSIVLPETSTPQQAIVTTYLPSTASPASPTAPASPASASYPAPSPTASIAPSSAVFVAASVQPSANVPPAPATAAPSPAAPNPAGPNPAAPNPAVSVPGAAPGGPAFVVVAPGTPLIAVPPGTTPPGIPPAPGSVAAPIASNTTGGVPQPIAAQTGNPAVPAAAIEPEDAIVAGQVAQLGLEARIAATHAASIDIADLVRPAQPLRIPIEGLPLRSLPSVPARTPVPTAPPLVTARPQPAVPPPVAVSARPLVPPSPEGSLLERLRIPLAPLTVAAAKIAATAGTVLPRALARLETLLAGVASQDGRAATLRTLLTFAGRLDPANARALPEQLAAFVNNFVGGPESKLAAMIRAFAEAEAPEGGAPAAPGDSAPSATPAPPGAPAPGSTSARAPSDAPAPAAPGAAPAQAAAAATVEPAVAARVAERAMAMQYDAKAMVAALLESPPQGATPELTTALNDVLTAITAMQVNVLTAQNANPNVISIPLPVFYKEQGFPVQMHVSRDAPNGKKLDGDNFSIAFVLDTKSLGTVAIDVQTAGRVVSVNVKTEGAPAASRFRSSMDDLRGRLEHLRYNVANMTAAVAPHRFGAAPEPKPSVEVAPERRTSSVLDMQA